MKLKLDISPCPNDTFMFDALINGRIDTGGLEFEVGYHDIERLNRRALDGQAEIIKISYALLPSLAGFYSVCDSGSALGRGNGPLLVTRHGNAGAIKDALAGRRSTLRIAVPGLHTTANLLVQNLFPGLHEVTPILFSEIAEAVSNGLFDAGVLIHEGRFTYCSQGLECVYDLGREWERATGLPLPLGGIAVSNRLPEDIALLFDRSLKQSIQYAMADPGISRPFVRSHAREMDDQVIESHIALFVNEFSLSLGQDGRTAVMEMTGTDQGIFL
ncbi:MAG: 1,4-dihydroxy-6-naphthoate synthase [Alistipes sp.]|nr:1,4-dihydroxy-6-naphthoate synthase [Alistipes sp.]